MREAAAGMERVSVQESARAFWWTVGAFFEAIVAGGLDPGFGAKQLAARLDLQIRRVVEGSVKVATRLRREVLYYVAVSSPVTPTVAAVQKGYGLTGLIPSAEALNADLIRLQPILREMREQLGTAKNIWLRVTLGRADSLPKLRETLQSVHGNAVAIGNDALNELTASLVACLDTMPPSGEVPDVLAMEYATGILLAESAVSNYGGLASNFPKQVAAMLTRLEAAREARPLPAGTGALIDGIFRRAQERVLLAQVAREIQANLRRMEQVLDAFFRDPTKRSEIAALGKDSHQIRGALRMLEQDDAERLLGLCEARIESYANPETPVDDEDLELLAESLSALGFFVEALEQQRSDRKRLIAPLLAQTPRRGPGRRTTRRGRDRRGRGRGSARHVAAARRGNPAGAGRCRGPRRLDARSSRISSTTPRSSTTPSSSSRRRKRWPSSRRWRRPTRRHRRARGGGHARSPRAARRRRHPPRRCRPRRSGCSRQTPIGSTPS